MLRATCSSQNTHTHTRDIIKSVLLVWFLHICNGFKFELKTRMQMERDREQYELKSKYFSTFYEVQ